MDCHDCDDECEKCKTCAWFPEAGRRWNDLAIYCRRGHRMDSARGYRACEDYEEGDK
jgi:hypothetical protein